MPDIDVGGIHALDRAGSIPEFGKLVSAALLAADNGIFYAARHSYLTNTAYSVSLAAGASLIVWTPTAGSRIWLNKVMFFGANAGKWELYLGATLVFRFNLLNAETKIVDLFPFGYHQTAINEVLTLKNATSLGAEAGCTAFGAEY